MGTKGKYHIRNWSQYNKSLIQRGSITVWFSEDTVEKWLAPGEKGKRGRPKVYSDDAILTALIIRSVFHLPLRALEGFLRSLILLMGLGLRVPSYTQICRRAKYLKAGINRYSNNQVKDLVIDSTGLKVYGEGEWKVRQHGHSKRRIWRKLHLAVCPDSNEVIFEILTENSKSDCEVYPELLKAIPKTTERTYGDGAYDTKKCYQASDQHGLQLITPPQKNAVYRKNAPSYLKSRNDAILEILGLGGDGEARKLWKKLKGYHLRSLSETAMFRFKALFGSHLKARGIQAQKAEVRAKCEALNIITGLGMPESEWIAA